MSTGRHQRQGGRRALFGTALAGLAAFALFLAAYFSPAISDRPVPPGRGDGSDTATATGSQWRLTWASEFNGPAGTPLDDDKWEYNLGGTGWGNEELQYYTDSTENAALDGEGHLAITARKAAGDRSCWYGPCRYTSARLLTEDTFAQRYGRFEARIKVPRGQGIWPAFWMLGANLDEVGYPESGEIDIMENLGKRPSTIHGSLHAPGYDFTGDYTFPNGEEVAAEFHTFAVEWSKTSIAFYVDGARWQELTKKEVGSGWVFDHPFFVILNVAVGGTWPGPPDGTTKFPQRMLVDYVRVYERTG